MVLWRLPWVPPGGHRGYVGRSLTQSRDDGLSGSPRCPEEAACLVLAEGGPHEVLPGTFALPHAAPQHPPLPAPTWSTESAGG